MWKRIEHESPIDGQWCHVWHTNGSGIGIWDRGNNDFLMTSSADEPESCNPHFSDYLMHVTHWQALPEIEGPTE